MEDPLPQESPPVVVLDENTKDSKSAENFQKFIFELFDKNGVLNDLRAYLRGHIVNVLRSAQTGEPPACQKHFTQRLDLCYQALNMLIAEYLLRLEFSYSFSVFISEIPLSNMVFEFAKTLMKSSNSDNMNLRFKDRDVWSILNHLGIKCDSDHASSILEMYKSQEYYPLLLCILKNMPMYNKESVCTDQEIADNSTSSRPNSSVSFEEKPTKCSHKKSSHHDKCGHYMSCRTCQNKITRLKEKYMRSKKNFTKNLKNTNLKPQNVESLMKNIGVIERDLVDEMFQQLKDVYEAEIEMVKEEQEKKVKRRLADHALTMQQRHNEMEKSLKAREEELELKVQEKKKFLWELARALRDQHQQMARAMRDVRLETDRLADKEESLKTQLAEAEQVLRQRGEEMRSQISNELIILESHLDSMKLERENINRERSELSRLKFLCDSKEKCMKINNIDDLKPHYELLKDELSILRKYIESTRLEPKCVIERATMTELSDVTSKLSIVLNNGRDAGSTKTLESRAGNSHLVNDLKKQKNVNFSQSNLDEIYRGRSRERSRSSLSSEAGDSFPHRDPSHQRDILLTLRQENERLRAFATQQREHIDELSSQQARLHAELAAERYRQSSSASRPRTAPALMPQSNYLHRINVSASSNTVNYGWRKGAGEELSLFSNAQPRIYLPGDTFPFIGVLKDRHSDNRRHLINQWRMLRRASPVRIISKNRTSPVRRDIRDRPASAGPSLNTDRATHEQSDQHNVQVSIDLSRQSDIRDTHRTALTLDVSKNREKSPKSVLKEAKNKLRDKNKIKPRIEDTTTREKSPNSVLREAKLRLRKLEIEAEAVEKSYMDFRKRQSELKNDKQRFNLPNEESIVCDRNRDSDIHKRVPIAKCNVSHEAHGKQQYKDFNKSMKTDFDRYLREYKTVSNLETVNFRNRNLSTEKAKPIPKSYSTFDEKDKVNDYLETPLNEFRKLYHSARPRSLKETRIKTPTKCPDNSQRKTSLRTETREDKTVPEILNQNISNLVDVNNDSVKSISEDTSRLVAKTRNSSEVDLLRKENNLDTSREDRIEQDILNQSTSKLYNLPNKDTDGEVTKLIIDSTNLLGENLLQPSELIVNSANLPEENLLRVEVESVSTVSGLKITESQTRDVILFVESASNIDEIKSTDDKISPKMTIIVSPKKSNPKGPNTIDQDEIKSTVENISPKMVIIVSPKRSSSKEPNAIDQSDRPKSVSPDQGTNLTRDDILNDIFLTDDNNIISSVQMQLELPKDILDDGISEEEKLDEEYPDDFSADVDNYNIRSDYENNSPVSLPKTSDDENFWD